MKQIISITIALITVFCHCYTNDKKEFKRFYQDSDYVLLLKPIENAIEEKEVKELFDAKKKGTEVKFEIIEVYKGKISKKETVISFQLETFVCSREFSFDQNYLVWGKKINSFITKPRKLNYKVLPSGEKVYEPDVEIESLNGTMVFYNEKNENLEYWNKLNKNHLILSTNLCSSDLENGSFHQYLKSQK